MKPKAQEREIDRPTEDDIAQVSLGGTRGSKDLEPAKMTRRQQQDMPARPASTSTDHHDCTRQHNGNCSWQLHRIGPWQTAFPAFEDVILFLARRGMRFDPFDIHRLPALRTGNRCCRDGH